jgi:hypothetical protein
MIHKNTGLCSKICKLCSLWKRFRHFRIQVKPGLFICGFYHRESSSTWVLLSCYLGEPELKKQPVIRNKFRRKPILRGDFLCNGITYFKKLLKVATVHFTEYRF